MIKEYKCGGGYTDEDGNTYDFIGSFFADEDNYNDVLIKMKESCKYKIREVK